MRKTLFAACLALSLSPALGADSDMEQAMEYYEKQNYPLARLHFIAAARSGDARAYEILGFMHAFGPAMYPGIERDYQAAARFFDLAARGGRPVGRYMSCAFSRRIQDARPLPQYCFDWIAETGKPGPR